MRNGLTKLGMNSSLFDSARIFCSSSLTMMVVSVISVIWVREMVSSGSTMALRAGRWMMSWWIWKEEGSKV